VSRVYQTVEEERMSNQTKNSLLLRIYALCASGDITRRRKDVMKQIEQVCKEGLGVK
jgi:hypothetical protein